MALNETVEFSATGVSDGNSATFDGSGTDTGEVEIQEIGGTGDADVFREIDTNGDGSFNLSVKIDSFSSVSNFHSQINNLTVTATSQLKITNTSGSSADFYAVGMEVGQK